MQGLVETYNNGCNISRKSILVVDNAKSINRIISSELTDLGYKCKRAYSLKDIKEKVKESSFKYIVLNLYLADAQEIELIKSVKKLSSAKIIILTSAISTYLRDEIFKLGILDYLYKENIFRTVVNINKLIQNVERNKDSNVLIIERSKVSRWTVKALLVTRNYNVYRASTGKEGLEIIEKKNLDLVILGMELEDMHGLDVLKHIESDINNKFPVIGYSKINDDNIKRKALKGGVTDYFNKSVSIEEFLLKTDKIIDSYKKCVKNEKYKEFLSDRVKSGISKIKVLNNEIEDTQAEIINTMGALGEGRCKETGNHVRRVANYSKLLAILYGFSEHEAELLKLASPMHDIGKLAIPEHILQKPGFLTDDEMDIVKMHPKHGYDMLSSSNRKIMKAASIVSYEHHEKYDGSGYPRGLKGKKIHIYGRITALADVFDALGSKRVYKDTWEDERIWKLFKEERGNHFDPELVDLFFAHIDKFIVIRERYKD